MLADAIIGFYTHAIWPVANLVYGTNLLNRETTDSIDCLCKI